MKDNQKKYMGYKACNIIIKHERSESDISFYEVTNALLAWLGFISIHVDINNLEE